MSIYSRSSVLPQVKREGFYGLVSYKPDGSVNRFAYIDTGSQTVTGYFIALGWKFVPGAGFFDKKGNIAEAYKDGEFVTYPDWP